MTGVAGKHPVIQLREIQLLLKREKLLTDYRKEAAANSLEALTVKHEQLLCVRKLLFLYNQHSIGGEMSTSTANSVIAYFFDDRKNVYAVPSSMFDTNAEVTLPYHKLLIFIHKNPHAFAEMCVEAVKRRPEVTDNLTFSVIPAIFGNIWCNEMGDLFVKFILEVRKLSEPIAKSFSRLMFVLPEFRLFVELLLDSIPESPVDLPPDAGKLGKFVKSFTSVWKSHVEFAPALIQKVLKGVKKPEEFVIHGLVEPMMVTPVSYGLMKMAEDWRKGVPELLLPLLKNDAPALTKALLDAKSPAALMTSADIEEIVPNIHLSMILSGGDLELLSFLSECAKKPKDGKKIAVVPFDPHIETKKYIFYVSREAADFDETTQMKQDLVESALRQLLADSHVIPLAASSVEKPDITELLRSQVNLSREDRRLHLQMQINDFERLRGNPAMWKFEDILSLLRTKFKERESQRLADLRKITFWTSCVHSLAIPVQKYLGETLWAQTFPVQKRFFRKWLSQKKGLKVSVPEYKTSFLELAYEWKKWCTSSGISFNLDFMIMADALSLEIGIDKYIAEYPYLKEYDKYVYQYTTKIRDRVLEEWRNKPKAWEQAIVKDEHLTTLVRLIKKFLNAKSAAMKMLYWSDMPRNISRILQIAGVGVPGADELTPCIFLILTAAKPKNFVSSVCFVLSFVGSPYSEFRLSSGKPLSTEYTEFRSWDYQRTSLAAVLMDYQNQYETEGKGKMTFPQGSVDESC